MAEDPKKDTKESDKLDTPVAPTAEEIEAIAKENLAEFFDNDRLSAKKVKPPPIDFPWADETAPKDEKKDESKPAEKPEPKAEEKKDDKPKEEKKPKRKSPLVETEPAEGEQQPDPPKPKAKPRQSLEDEDIEAVADRVEQRLKPKDLPKEDKKEDPLAGVTDGADRRKLEALQHLSQTDKYKGRDLVKEVKTFWQREQEYIRAWRKDHPGEKFVDIADEHQEFYSENEPAIADDEIASAREDMLFKRAQDEAEKKSDAKAEKRLSEELEPIKRKETMDRVMPVILQTISDSTSAMIAESVPEFADIIKDGITKETVEKMGEIDPVALELVERESQILRARAGELARMEHVGQYFKFEKDRALRTPDGDVIFPHTDIVDTAIAIEQAVLKKPAEDRIHEGRQFITKQDLMAKRNLIFSLKVSDDTREARLADLENRFWHVQPADIHAAFIAQSAAKVRRTLELTNRRQQHLESKKTKAVESEKNGKATQDDEKPIKPASKPQSKPPASVAAESDAVNSRVPGGKAGQDNTESVVKDWFG